MKPVEEAERMHLEIMPLMLRLMALALQTDSTRVGTFELPMGFATAELDLGSYHGLSHHGKDPEKIKELKLIEEAEFTVFNEFLTKLRAIEEGGQTLLDQTSVMFGSNLGNASSHDWHNLPIVVAGGGYKHGSYVAHDEKNNTPLANLFVSLAQRMGLEVDSFGSSTAVGIRGLS